MMMMNTVGVLVEILLTVDKAQWQNHKRDVRTFSTFS